MDARQQQLVRNETLFREVNENIARLGEGESDRDERVHFVCECGDATCTEPLALTLSEYERVRADRRTFVVVPGHEDPEVEDVESAGDGYLVVRKRAEAGELAESRPGDELEADGPPAG